MDKQIGFIMKKILRKIPGYKKIRAYYSVIKGTYSIKYGIFGKAKLLRNFFSDLKNYSKLQENKKFIFSPDNISPQIYDNVPHSQQLDYVYFYQDSWCAEKVFQNKPEHHFDIGSKAEMLGIISQFTPTTMIDLRPLDVNLPNLEFVQGDILSLPFEDNSIKSLSAICVVEHIGLGRYGDSLDQFGSEKAVEEFKRILANNGNLYISLPIDKENKIYFNAHRAFTREYILELFKPLRLIEEKYIYKNELINNYDSERGFGTGLFWFKK